MQRVYLGNNKIHPTHTKQFFLKGSSVSQVTQSIGPKQINSDVGL